MGDRQKIKIDDFIPNYPSIDDPEFQQLIMNKSEFTEIDTNNTSTVDPPYFDFQVNIARLLSPFTPYKRALLYLDVGVGKCVHPDTSIKISNLDGIDVQTDLWMGISNLYEKYSNEIIDENWSLPNAEIYVYSWDGNQIVKRKITKFYRERSPSTLVRIKQGTNVLIKTPGHRLYTSNGWTHNLKSGDRVLDSNGKWIEITVDNISSDTEYVYDLEIDDTHAYLADGFITHNTCSAILVHEISKLYYGGGFRKTVVMAKGPSLLESYKDKFLTVCPGIADDVNESDELKKNFIFKTVSAFASSLRDMKDAEIVRDFDNRIFILDESHVLKNHKSDTYTQYSRLFSLCTNSTVIMMTGTPNTNAAWEAINQINLLKPESDRIETGNKFIKQYYEGYKLLKKDELMKYYSGYVIYLKQSEDIPPRIYIENPKYPSDMDMKLYMIPMSRFQSDVYSKSLKEVQKTFLKEKTGDGSFKINELKYRIVKNDKGEEVREAIEYTSDEGGAFLRLILESSLFVYPDGTYGGTGYKKNVYKNKEVVINDELLAELKADIGKYSIIYKTMLDIIKANPTRVIYIYFDNLNNSGLRLFAKILEKLAGYKYTRGGSLPAGRRYTIIDGSMKEKDIALVLNSIGSSENADGSRIQILLGSEVTQTGLTIGNATICMVANSQFTDSSTSQITNRINRPGSLDHLIAAGLPTDTSIYLLCPFSPYIKGDSAYLQTYKIAQEKSRYIEPMNTIMKRSSIFCPLNYIRNVRDESENYRCYSAVPDKSTDIWTYTRELDNSTDYLYFHDKEIAELKDIIIADITKLYSVNITKYIDDYPPMVVYRTAKLLCNRQHIVDIDGMQCPINNNGDLFFVDPTISKSVDSVIYTQARLLPFHISLRSIIDSQNFADDEKIYNKLLSSEDKDKMLVLFNKLSKSTQNIIWESAYQYKDINKTFGIISKFKPVYTIDNKVYNIVYAEPIAKDAQYGSGAIVIEDSSKLRVLLEDGWAWVPENIALGLVGKIKGVKTKTKLEIKGDLYSTMGSDNIFKIFVGKGNAGGRTCHQLSGKVLMELFKKLDLFKVFDKKIKTFIKENPKTESALDKVLKISKKKSIPDDFTLYEKVGAYYALGLTNVEKCALLETEFKKRGLHHTLE